MADPVDQIEQMCAGLTRKAKARIDAHESKSWAEVLEGGGPLVGLVAESTQRIMERAFRVGHRAGVSCGFQEGWTLAVEALELTGHSDVAEMLRNARANAMREESGG